MYIIVSLLLLLESSTSTTAAANNCLPSSCGNIGNISYPFRLKNHPRKCGRPELELHCESNRTTLYLDQRKYYVKEISYQNQTIRLVDAGLDVQDDCSVPPTFSLQSPLFFPAGDYYFRTTYPRENNIYFMSCPSPPLHSSSSKVYVNYSTCINNTSSSSQNYYFCAALGISSLQDIPNSCNITTVYPFTFKLDYSLYRNISISNIHNSLLWGFDLTWYRILIQYPYWFPHWLRTYLENLVYAFNYAKWRGKWIYFSLLVGFNFSWILGVWQLGRVLIAIICSIVIVVHKCRRRHLSLDDSIEDFLQSHNNFTPIRYTFSDIKKMTKGFKDKLGQGGYGSVFKAKLRSGNLVAIKLLAKSSKANGQDFISEVATIGRIHHVNVVKLVGFCADGSKRALVYDFMPNGSLDKFIFSGGENKIPLSWEIMYKIVLGVARGIEYLHRGCNMQILHFDIKPHNILLDENFVPKVSDFGLAKLYSTDDSIVSLTAARGTLGYIAPELFYKTIGGVSYKADVYSFGMLLMEMVGRRKNVNTRVENSSQIYFPYWVYDRIYQGEDLELGDATEELKKLVRKMTIVALWCIQMKPVDRPSMSEVLDMLERETELLQIPPKPSFHPEGNPIIDQGTSSSSSIDISSTN